MNKATATNLLSSPFFFLSTWNENGQWQQTCYKNQ
jgi:hypothetical protein